VSEIDLDAAVWVVPGDRMKAGREHRVPLCAQAVELLKKMPRFVGNEHVFPSPRGKVLSDMALLAVMRRMEVDAVHMVFAQPLETGLESVQTIQESLLNKLLHTLESKVEAAYRRGDALEKRRTMMQEWSDFLYATK
jgi:integrase